MFDPSSDPITRGLELQEKSYNHFIILINYNEGRHSETVRKNTRKIEIKTIGQTGAEQPLGKLHPGYSRR